jgi:hypothetical protein
MAEGYTIKVEGLRELIARGDTAVDKTKRKLVREGLRDAVKPAQHEATRLFTRYNAKVAGKYRTVVRKTGEVAIEQSVGRKTGKRPDFGRLQIKRALLPGFQTTYPVIVKNVQEQVDKIGQEFVR